MKRLSINDFITLFEGNTKNAAPVTDEIAPQSAEWTPLQIDKSENIIFSGNIKNVLDNTDLFRKGTVINNLSHLNNINCSNYLTLYQSLIHNVKDNLFLSKDALYQETFIFNFIEELKKTLHGIPPSKHKKELFAMMILTDNINPQFIQHIAKYLDINLFVVNLLEDTINLVDSNYYVEKKNVFVIKHKDNIYEPLYTANKSDIIIIDKLEKITSLKNEKILVIEKVEPVIEKSEIPKENSYKDEASDHEKEEIKEEIKQGLDDMKMDELKKIAKTLKVTVTALVNKKRTNKDKKTLLADIKAAQELKK
jgi:hypothetical protein